MAQSKCTPHNEHNQGITGTHQVIMIKHKHKHLAHCSHRDLHWAIVVHMNLGCCAMSLLRSVQLGTVNLQQGSCTLGLFSTSYKVSVLYCWMFVMYPLASFSVSLFTFPTMCLNSYSSEANCIVMYALAPSVYFRTCMHPHGHVVAITCTLND